MTALTALWLPILLAAVFVFLVSSIIHMALPIHRSDFKKLPEEDKIRDAVRGTPAGQYMFPNAGSMKEMGTPEMQEKLRVGPVGVMMVRSPESWNMGTALLKWFVYTLVVGVFCAYLTGIGHAPGTEYLSIFRFAGAIAFLGYVFSHVHEWTWKGLDTSIMLKFMIDGVVYSLITAGTFAWLWPAA